MSIWAKYTKNKIAKVHSFALEMKLLFASLLCTAFAAEVPKETKMKEHVAYWLNNFTASRLSVSDFSQFSRLPEEIMSKIITEMKCATDLSDEEIQKFNEESKTIG